MKLLKIVLFIFYVAVLIMVPLGLILDNKLLSFIGYVALLLSSILSLIRLVIERKKKDTNPKNNLYNRK